MKLNEPKIDEMTKWKKEAAKIKTYTDYLLESDYPEYTKKFYTRNYEEVMRELNNANMVE